MTNKQKAELARLVKEAIDNGYNINETVKRLARYGFNEGTIRKYYKVWGLERGTK